MAQGQDSQTIGQSVQGSIDIKWSLIHDYLLVLSPTLNVMIGYKSASLIAVCNEVGQSRSQLIFLTLIKNGMYLAN